jgi:hypothetical protein
MIYFDFTTTLAFVDRCFDQQISGSLLIIGPDRSDKRILVDRILKYAQLSRQEKIDIADINGNVHTSDHDAIGTIASQLNIISSSDGHIPAFESIQAHFQVSSITSLLININPAIPTHSAANCSYY